MSFCQSCASEPEGVCRHCFEQLQQENALLTKKLKGLENIDEDKANLRDIILGAIENFEGIGYQYEANDLKKKLKAELGE